MEDYKSIRKLAESIGIPESTARRYADTFFRFLVSKKIGRNRQYSPESASVLLRINELYAAGKKQSEVEEILSGEVPQTTDTEPEEQSLIITSQAKAIQDMKNILQVVWQHMDKQSEEIRQLREELAAMREALNLLPDARKRPWWKFWG